MINHIAAATQVTGNKFLEYPDALPINVGTQVFALSMQDIKKALETKSKNSPEKIQELPSQVKKWARLFKED